VFPAILTEHVGEGCRRPASAGAATPGRKAVGFPASPSSLSRHGVHAGHRDPLQKRPPSRTPRSPACGTRSWAPTRSPSRSSVTGQRPATTWLWSPPMPPQSPHRSSSGTPQGARSTDQPTSEEIRIIRVERRRRSPRKAAQELRKSTRGVNLRGNLGVSFRVDQIAKLPGGT
jgi:hypothetical protein